MRRERLKVGIIAVVAVLVLGALAIASRISAESEPAVATQATDPELVVGVLADLSPAGPIADKEFVRGIRLWQAQLQSAAGIVFGHSGLAAVKVIIRSPGGSSASELAAARGLVRDGVTAFLGPPTQTEAEALAAVARSSHVLMIAPFPKPTSVPRSPYTYFLSPPPIGAAGAVYDALDQALHGRRRRPRVAVLAPVGAWATIGRQAVLLAQQRGYAAVLERIPGSDPRPALRQARRFSPDLLYVLSSPHQVSRWETSDGLPSDPPWATAASEIQQALGSPGRSALIVTVPWSPLTSAGGPVFPPGLFTQAYEDAYGALPTPEAASSAASAIALTQAVNLARSTDAGRLLLAMPRLNVPSLFGTLKFDVGQQTPAPPPAALLVPAGRPLRSLAPEPPGRSLLRQAVPAGSGRSVSRSSATSSSSSSTTTGTPTFVTPTTPNSGPPTSGTRTAGPTPSGATTAGTTTP